jgi:hypothetical protein
MLVSGALVVLTVKNMTGWALLEKLRKLRLPKWAKNKKRAQGDSFKRIYSGG